MQQIALRQSLGISITQLVNGREDPKSFRAAADASRDSLTVQKANMDVAVRDQINKGSLPSPQSSSIRQMRSEIHVA